jgi:IPT/TIG domain
MILTSSSATLTFDKGVPLSSFSIKPELYFTDTSTNITHWSQFAAAANISNPITSNPSVSPLSCSFAGGCLLTVSQYGLMSTLKSSQSENSLKVCGQVCTPSEADSSLSAVKCMLPSLATTYSMTNYNITSQ